MSSVETVQAAGGSALTIREIAGIMEYRACQEVQRRAWSITQDGYIMPVSLLVAVQKYGGLILGAFDESGELVGFVFGFLASVDGELVLYSQLAAVAPEFQSQNVGYLLKQAQLRRSDEMGLAAVAWSFDPMQSRNAYFNLTKLGATAKHYEVDMYGARPDPLNAGLATDRLLAVWRRSDAPPAPRERVEGEPVLWSERDGSGIPRIAGRYPEASAPRLLLEIPPDVQALRAADLELAKEWQLAIRSSFLACFKRGYRAVEFRRWREDGGWRAAYGLIAPGVAR